jgi:peptidoglycan/LPS O-acetylase OafA/YrhL
MTDAPLKSGPVAAARPILAAAAGETAEQRQAGHAAAAEFRLDIQGLRAIAVGLVVLFHIRPDRVPGGFVGVDVFFVVSGFLITGMLAREIERTGRLSLIGFYARRARRLLPAATSVLALVGLASLVFLPQISWQGTAQELAASTLYVENIWLYLNSIDYLARDGSPSPLQHYWSLSIEEQYYIVWPLLLLILVKLRGAVGSRRAAIALAALLLAISLTWSVVVAAGDAQAGYFQTGTRIWELTVGALAALLLSRPSGGFAAAAWPEPVGAVLAGLGIAGIVLAAFAFDRATAFPGAAALLPTVATALVILAGSRTSFGHSPWLLGTAPFQYLGTLSYALYLWHWPVILFFRQLADREPTLGDGAVIVAISIALAQLTKSLIEDPLRYGLGRRGLVRTFASSGAFMAACLCLAGAVLFYVMRQEAALLALGADRAQHPGALVLTGGAADRSFASGFAPALLVAKKDVPRIYRQGCQVSLGGVEPRPCEFGAKDGVLRVALVGDSHAAQWLPALEEMARLRHWRIVTHTKSSCPFIGTPIESPNAASCAEWNRRVVRRIIDTRPDVVVTSLIYNYTVPGAAADTNERLAEGLEKAWSQLASQGIGVVAIRTTPHFSYDVPDCVAAHEHDADRCGLAKDEAVLAVDPITLAAMRSPGVTMVDMNGFICPADRCSPIVGNVLVYRDKHHLTATYAATLASALEPFVLKAAAGHGEAPGATAR